MPGRVLHTGTTFTDTLRDIRSVLPWTNIRRNRRHNTMYPRNSHMPRRLHTVYMVHDNRYMVSGSWRLAGNFLHNIMLDSGCNMHPEHRRSNSMQDMECNMPGGFGHIDLPDNNLSDSGQNMSWYRLRDTNHNHNSLRARSAYMSGRRVPDRSDIPNKVQDNRSDMPRELFDTRIHSHHRLRL